jgi:beta-phosphoglucomutase
MIFDLDGVLTDTEEFHYRSWQRLADELDLPFSRAASQELRGRSRGDALDLFLAERGVGSAEREELLARKNRYYLAQIAGLGQDDLAPGALPLLREAQAKGVGLGMASSSCNARLVCRRLGILEYFAAFVDGCSGLRPKPSPDMFLWAAGRLGLAPARCTVVEDAAAGVAAALAGGFRVVGLGPPERVGEAHLVLPGLAGSSLADLLPAGDPESGNAEGPDSEDRDPKDRGSADRSSTDRSSEDSASGDSDATARGRASGGWPS